MDNFKGAMDRLHALGKSRVLVGIPSEKALRREEDGESIDVNNAMLGYIHENGSPARNIPARPWLIPGVRENTDKIAAQALIGTKRVLAGTDDSIEPTLHRMGLTAQNAVKRKIIDGPFAPLSEVTLERRREKGRTGTRPLNDTGQMRNAVIYVIDKDGSR